MAFRLKQPNSLVDFHTAVDGRVDIYHQIRLEEVRPFFFDLLDADHAPLHGVSRLFPLPRFQEYGRPDAHDDAEEGYYWRVHTTGKASSEPYNNTNNRRYSRLLRVVAQKDEIQAYFFPKIIFYFNKRLVLRGKQSSSRASI